MEHFFILFCDLDAFGHLNLEVLLGAAVLKLLVLQDILLTLSVALRERTYIVVILFSCWNLFHSLLMRIVIFKSLEGFAEVQVDVVWVVTYSSFWLRPQRWTLDTHSSHTAPSCLTQIGAHVILISRRGDSCSFRVQIPRWRNLGHWTVTTFLVLMMMLQCLGLFGDLVAWLSLFLVGYLPIVLQLAEAFV